MSRSITGSSIFSTKLRVLLRLSDIADVQLGHVFRGKVEPDAAGNVRVIQVKDMADDGRLLADNLVSVRLDRSPEPYRVRHGDVLFLGRGARQSAGVVDLPLEDTIASGYFFILRIRRPDVRSEFLAWYLRQPSFLNALRPYVRGTHMPVVSADDLRCMPIELPPLAAQRALVALQELGRRERQLCEALYETRSKLLHAACAAAARKNDLE